MPGTDLFQQALEAARSGRAPLARELLARLIRGDPKNPEYWIWMSSVAADRKEKVFCLEQALSLDPENELIKRGLVILGSRSPDLATQPQGPSRIVARAPIPLSAQRKNPERRWAQGRSRVNLGIGAISLVLVIALILILGSVALGWAQRVSMGPPTATRLPTVSLTPSPAFSPTARIETTPSASTPLAESLGVSTTPTSLYPATPHPILGAYSLAMQAYQDGEWDKAESYFRQALEVDPSSPDIHYWMGEAYRRSQRPTEALSEFATAVNLGPGFAPSYLGVAYLDLAAGKPNDALDQADRAIELDPNFVEAYLLRADLLGRKGDSQGAFENLQSAVQVAPQNALALALLSGVEVTQGNLDAAWRDATRSQALDPTELESYLALGRAYLAMGLPKEAMSQLQVYTVYESDDAAGWTDLGDVYLASKEFGSADDAFAAALRLDSHIADAWIGRSEALGMEGRFGEGTAVAAQAAALFPNSTAVLAQYGRALISAGDGEEAVSVLTRAMGQGLGPEELGTLLSLRAEAYKLLGEARLAQGDWNELVGLNGAPESLRLDAYDELRALRAGSPSPTAP